MPTLGQVTKYLTGFSAKLAILVDRIGTHGEFSSLLLPRNYYYSIDVTDNGIRIVGPTTPNDFQWKASDTMFYII